MAKRKLELGLCLCTPQKETRQRPAITTCSLGGCSHVIVALTREALLAATQDHEKYHTVRSAYTSVVS